MESMTTKRNIWLLVGPRESGKSTFSQRIAAEAKRMGWSIAGVTMPSVFTGSEKTAVELIDLTDGSTHVLMHRPEHGAGSQSPSWLKNYTTIQLADKAFQTDQPVDLLIFDELNALELLEGRGIKAALPSIDAGNYKVALISLRHELLNDALQRWPEARVIDISDPGALVDFLTATDTG